MATVDDKVVAMSFESSRFSTGISTAMGDLSKLNTALKNVGTDNGLDGIEKSANKVSFGGLSSVIDKLKGKFHFPEATEGFNEVERGSNKVHLSGVSSAIDKLRGKFHFPEASEGFSEIERASGKVTFHGLHEAIQGAAKSFSIIQGAAAVALGNLATQAAGAGRKVASGLFSPIKGGLEEYETNLNSVQTILANTQASGATLKDVNKALLDLNKYSDKTIYNFGQMARNIGTFTAAGVDLKTSTASIKGIANLAALSGSNAEQASTAMYQLSQAISSGKVGLQDWNSVVNAGMGGAAFQRALATTATHMGTLKDSAVKLSGPMKNVKIDGASFRESIMAKPGEQSWLTSDVLTKTLQQFTGDMTDAQLKAEGFTDAQIKAIQAQAKTAQDAATKVKTLSGVLDTAKEAAGSGWAQTWQIVFGDFEEAKKLFTGMSNAINGFIGASSNARNSVLSDWKELGGRADLINGIKNIFEGLGSVLKPIKEAFRDIFPAKTGQDLKDITQSFENFTEKLKIGPETAEDLKRTFKGLFALLDIGKQILGGIFTALGRVFGAVGEGSGGVLNLTGNLGDLLVRFDNWLKKGDRLKHVFETIGDVLAVPVEGIKTLAGALGGLFGSGGNKAEGVAASLNGMNEALKPAQKAVDGASAAWEGFLDILKKVGDFLSPVLDAIGTEFSKIGQTVVDALNNQNFDSVFTVLQTGLVAGIFLTIKKALGGGFNVDIGGGMLKNLSKSFDTLTGSLTAMQQNIKSNTMLQIAAAVGVLAVAVVALSLVNPDRLASAMTAITIGFGQLMGAMALLTKIGGTAGFVKMPVIAGSLILLAAAIDILAIAVIALSKLSWEEIARGLTAVAGIMVAVGLGAQLLKGSAASLTVASVGLLALAVALNVMALAMKIFATMSWEEIGKGLAGAAGGIVAIGVAARMLPASMLITGPGLLVLAAGLTVLAGAVKLFGSMKLETLGKGIGAIAVALVAIGLAMGVMPPTLPLTAAGLVLVSIALTGIAGAVALMGNMDFGTLAKGIGGIAASLIVLGVGLTAMVAALPGAAALLVASAALAIFVPVLGMLGTMSWGTIGKGLAAVAASLLVIGAAGLVAAPALLLLGVALGVFGVGVLAVGAGVRLLAEGIAILARDGSKGVAIFIAALTGMIAILPKVVIDFVKGLVQIVAEIADLAPKVVDSMAKILESLLDVIIKAAPKVAQAATALITAMLKILADNIGPIIKAGWNLLLALLKGIDDHIEQVVTQTASIIAKFLNAVADNIPKIISAGTNILIKFLFGISDNIDRVITAATSIVIHLATGIADNVGRIVTAGANMITKFIDGIANNIDDLIGRGAAMINRIVEGIGNRIGDVVEKGVDVATRLIRGLASAATELASAGGDALLSVLRGIRRWVDANAETVGAEGRKIATGLVGGILNGVVGFDLSGQLIKKVRDAISDVLDHFHIGSPSRVTAEEIGKPLAQGIAMGFENEGHVMTESITSTTQDALETLKASFRNLPDLIDMDVNPTITPVLDLTQIQKDAQKLSDLTNVVPINAAASFGAASAISAAQAVPADTTLDPETGAKLFKFEQNNYSPEALSEAEIYRQTNNQLSQAKSALGL